MASASRCKAGLFDAVWEDLVRQVVDAMPLNVHDLPGAAVMLSDIYAEHPELPRLSLGSGWSAAV